MSLQSISRRWPLNVPGRFYVIDECLDCNLCQEMVPSVFKRDNGWSYVYRQPQSQEELSLCVEVVEGCPLNAVRSDGEDFDWIAVPSVVDRDRLLK